MSPHPLIKLAESEDVPEILAMIKELASYEKNLQAVTATEDSLRQILSFGAAAKKDGPRHARSLLICAPLDSAADQQHDMSRSVAGMAVYFDSYNVWTGKRGTYIEDLFVRPQYRKRGYGKLLIQSIAKEAYLMGGDRIQWTCMKWNEPSLEFYRALGAKEMDERVIFRAQGEALRDLAGESIDTQVN